jgi:hypothetical protein
MAEEQGERYTTIVRRAIRVFVDAHRSEADASGPKRA